MDTFVVQFPRHTFAFEMYLAAASNAVFNDNMEKAAALVSIMRRDFPEQVDRLKGIGSHLDRANVNSAEN